VSIMATGDRRLDRRSSNLVILAVSAAVAIAVGVATFQPALDAQGTDRDARKPVAASARCLEADRANAAQLAALVERNRPADAPILERAIHALNVARRHCLYDWEGRGLDDYQWLSRWLSQHR
jgi:hypothetical protein